MPGEAEKPDFTDRELAAMDRARAKLASRPHRWQKPTMLFNFAAPSVALPMPTPPAFKFRFPS